ncbi:MAG TPA: tRNA (adenosine(37)-N6)-dimethylallyltransferase MiaA [Gemmatimonadales bacterium]
MADADTPVIVGPTGIGKTAVALALAAYWPLEVISADSRQVYRTLDVVTAKPTPRERQRVPHHLIDLIRPGERFSAGRFAVEAAEAIGDVRARGHLPVVVGGSGLYVKALVDGLFAEPPLDRPRRDAVAAVTNAMDHATLVRWAARLDPGREISGGRHRAARTIEIALLTGHPLSWWQRTAAVGGQLRPWIVRLTAPRAVLHHRIQSRAQEMIRRGMVEEVAAALADGAPVGGPGMDGVGVREAVAVLHGTLARDQLADAIATATRQYAKRQETWFRHQLGPNVLTLDAVRPPEEVAADIAEAWKAAA